MPRPIARVLQEFQNSVVTPAEPSLKTVIVGPHVHVRDYPTNKATIAAGRLGSSVEGLMTTDGASPTISATNITSYPDNIVGAVPIDSSVKVFIEGYVEVGIGADGVGSWRQNTITTAQSLAAVLANDRVVLNPTGVQVFEDLNVDFIAAGVVPGTDLLLIGADLHNIEEIQSEHRLLVRAVVNGSANTGFFASADGAANTNYTIGDNAATYDNKVGAGTTGQRIDWRQVYVFRDLSTNFLAAGVVQGHFLAIGGDTHYIERVVDANHLEVRGGTTVTAPQTRGEFALPDASANVNYTIGTQSGLFRNVLDFSVNGTGQRLASDSVVRFVYSVDSATQFTLGQFLPFAGTGGAPINFRVEHLVNDNNTLPSTEGWQPSVVSVNATTKVITVGPDSEVTYAGGPRRVIDAQMYAEYQSLRQDTAGRIQEATVSNVDSLLGTDSKLNPLRRGVGIAIANAGNAKINFLAVPSDDAAGHLTAQGILANDKSVYAIIPLTQNGSILQSYKSHVVALSSPTKAKRRILIAQQGSLPTTETLGQSVADGTAESTNVLFSPTSDFASTNVVPGDSVVLTSPTTNEYTVEAVLSGNRLRITGTFTSPEQAATGSVAFSMQRILGKAEQVTSLSAVPAGFNERRVTLVWPDVCVIGGDTDEPGYYLAAALGGMTAALPSHRMTTKIGVAGIDEIRNSNNYFDDDQINTLIDSGYYMFEQETPDASPFTSQQYTTVGVTADPRNRYLSSVRNFDFVTNRFQSVVDEFPGQWNVIEDLYGAVEESISSEARLLIADKRPQIGSPLLQITDLRVEPSATLSDKIEAWCKVRLPNVLDQLDVHLISI